jgi:hypothetical protein
VARVLVACEFSGTVRDAFLRAGHDAMSADLLPTEAPGPHYQGDARDLLREQWDLVIAHPPCTYLTRSGVRWLYEIPGRWDQMMQGVSLFRSFQECETPCVAIENPIMHRFALQYVGDCTQIVQPWHFGAPERKSTGLWLKGLPLLAPTDDVSDAMRTMHVSAVNRSHWVGPVKDRWKVRSILPLGMAEAMAEQWGAHVESGLASRGS